MSNWINYAEQRPETAGAYRWRLPSLAIPGLFITFTAHHRSRMAGFETVNSPVFDHWDGYNVHVPQGTQWQVLEESKDCERFRIIDVAVEGLAPSPCPYCNKVPVVDGITRYAGGGISTSNPDRFNAWTLKCCAWGSTPTYADPRELVARREAALAGANEIQRLNDQLDASNEAIEFAATQRVEQQKIKDALMADAKNYRDKATKLEALLREVINGKSRTQFDGDLMHRILMAIPTSVAPSLVECDACPRSSGCVDTCMKASASEGAGVQS